jgi:choline dehydrogenase-like flavoprotein
MSEWESKSWSGQILFFYRNAYALTYALRFFYNTGMKNHRCNWPRGKVIGGSSVLNYMLYVRGNKKDYDIWESLGNPGWGSEEALYYFKKSEDNRNPYLARTPFHSTGGYLTVQEAPWHTPLAAAFVQAGVEMGYVPCIECGPLTSIQVRVTVKSMIYIRDVLGQSICHFQGVLTDCAGEC